MNLYFTVAFGLLISSTTALELLGVYRNRKGSKGNTITENWTWLADHLPRPLRCLFRVGTLGFFLWCIVHFASQP